MDKEVLFRDDSLHEDVLFKCIEESEPEKAFSENSETNSSLNLTNENVKKINTNKKHQNYINLDDEFSDRGRPQN